MSSTRNIDLGFAEPFTNQWLSKSKYFPSKIGGRPSFLVLNPILGYDQLKCSKCQNIMRFILQLYAPIETDEQAFHRHLFIFGCGRQSQCSNEYRVFRCQLPRINSFYSDNPPDYEKNNDDYDPNPKDYGIKLCPICGIHANKRCSQCLKTSYCSKEHQIVHWKKGGHKEQCNKNIPEINNTDVRYENFVFPEYEIIIEETNENNNEQDEIKNDDNDNDIIEKEMKKFNEYVSKNKLSYQNENIENYLPEDENNELEQKTFEKFRKAINDDKIIRYNTDWYKKSNDNDDDDDCILWISNRNRIRNVPNCENCNSKRKFEFQIMPNLLNKIQLSKDDHMDWGTLLIFSCENHCTKNDRKNVLDYYQPEYIYNQTIL